MIYTCHSLSESCLYFALYMASRFSLILFNVVVVAAAAVDSDYCNSIRERPQFGILIGNVLLIMQVLISEPS